MSTDFPLEQHPFEAAGETLERLDRLARVAPRVTYVILCWEDSPSGLDAPSSGLPYATARHDRPSVILGPFTEHQARAMADTLTCECEVTMVSTSPPFWATAAPAER